MVTMKVASTLQQLIDQVLQNACDGRKNQQIIVPEQLSHQMERKLCKAGGDSISLRAEVLSFSRLSNRVASLYGGVARPVLDKGGRMLAMASALEQIVAKLQIYGSGITRPELLLKLISVVDELKSSGITPKQLDETSRELSGQLAVKTSELALIFDTYQTVISTMGFDPADQLMFLTQQLEEYSYAEDKIFYVFGFSDFTGQQYGVLEKLLTYGQEVYLGLVSQEREPGVGLIWETCDQLLALCHKIGWEVTLDWLPTPENPDHLERIQQGIFASPTTVAPSTPMVVLHQSTGLSDCGLDLAGKLRQAVEQGYRWSDLAVCTTQLPQARPILNRIFNTFSIPAYFAGNTPFAEKPVVSMVLSALECATGRMEYEEVFAYLKSGYSTITMEETDLLEQYAYTWNIAGSRWKQDWQMHPKGYGGKMTEEIKLYLVELNQIKQRAMEPIFQLRQSLQNSKNMGEQVLALYQFMETIDVSGKLTQLQQTCDLQQAQEYGQLYQILTQGFEQIYYVLGDAPAQMESFPKFVQGLLSQYDVGTIPATLDSVEVGDVSSMRFSNCKILYILGADDGVFPSQSTERSLLSDWERQVLQDLGLPLVPQQNLQLERELGATSQVLSSCRDQLVLYTYGGRPSLIFNQIQERLPEQPLEKDEEFPRIYWTNPAEFGGYLAGKQVEKEQLDGIWKACQEEIWQRAAYALGHLTAQGVAGLYGEKFRLSASKVDKFSTCPCAYFLQYGLGLQREKQATFDAPNYGTFVHWVLEETAKQVTEEGGFQAVTPERLVEIGEIVMGQYEDPTLKIMSKESPRLDYLHRRNFQEISAVVAQMGAELKKTDFRPTHYELEFSDKGQLPAVEFQGETAKAKLVGFVDRVDIYTENGVSYARVVDYKTGKKAFDYTEISNGLGMQMLLYLFALCDGGKALFGEKLQPAGVLYFPARNSLMSAKVKLTPEEAQKTAQKERPREGLITDDGNIIAAMEHLDGAPTFLPIKISSKGEISGSLVAGGQMHHLKSYVFDTLGQVVDHMASGAVEPLPMDRGPDQSPCNYCDYAQICHEKSGEINRKPLKKITTEEFWKLVEEGKHGRN